MNSIKTKIKNYTIIEGMCIGQIVAIPESNGFRIYVAWEWEAMAKKGVFAFIKGRDIVKEITSKSIIEVAEYGYDITGTKEQQELFKD